MREMEKMHATRWKRYIDSLSKSGTPRRLGGRDFGGRVRDLRKIREDAPKDSGGGEG
jgi:hypothetical protein